MTQKIRVELWLYIEEGHTPGLADVACRLYSIFGDSLRDFLNSDVTESYTYYPESGDRAIHLERLP